MNRASPMTSKLDSNPDINQLIKKFMEFEKFEEDIEENDVTYDKKEEIGSFLNNFNGFLEKWKGCLTQVEDLEEQKKEINSKIIEIIDYYLAHPYKIPDENDGEGLDDLKSLMKEQELHDYEQDGVYELINKDSNLPLSAISYLIHLFNESNEADFTIERLSSVGFKKGDPKEGLEKIESPKPVDSEEEKVLEKELPNNMGQFNNDFSRLWSQHPTIVDTLSLYLNGSRIFATEDDIDEAQKGELTTKDDIDEAQKGEPTKHEKLLGLLKEKFIEKDSNLKLIEEQSLKTFLSRLHSQDFIFKQLDEINAEQCFKQTSKIEFKYDHNNKEMTIECKVYILDTTELGYLAQGINNSSRDFFHEHYQGGQESAIKDCTEYKSKYTYNFNTGNLKGPIKSKILGAKTLFYCYDFNTDKRQDLELTVENQEWSQELKEIFDYLIKIITELLNSIANRQSQENNSTNKRQGDNSELTFSDKVKVPGKGSEKPPPNGNYKFGAL